MAAEKHLESYHSEAYLWARQCCNFDSEMAREVLQDAYLKILEGRAVYRQKSSFKTWLFSVIRFTAIDMAKQVSEEVGLDNVDDIADTRVVNLGERTQYENMIEQLPSRQAQLLLLVFYYDMTIEAAAQILEIGVGTARTHYERGKKKLKDQILKQGLRDAI